jgi:hypothetical protein
MERTTNRSLQSAFSSTLAYRKRRRIWNFWQKNLSHGEQCSTGECLTLIFTASPSWLAQYPRLSIGSYSSQSSPLNPQRDARKGGEEEIACPNSRFCKQNASLDNSDILQTKWSCAETFAHHSIHSAHMSRPTQQLGLLWSAGSAPTPILILISQ